MNWHKWPEEKPEKNGMYYVRRIHAYEKRTEGEGTKVPADLICARFIDTLEYTTASGWNTFILHSGEVCTEYAIRYDTCEWAPVDVCDEQEAREWLDSL